MRLVALVAFVLALAACGGTYEGTGSMIPTSDPGETNGRMFDFVTDKPDGDDWQSRGRVTSMWVAHSEDTKTDDLGGAKNLTEDESVKLWNLIDALDLPSRKAGKRDHAHGTVTLRLREPTDSGPHDVYTVYVARDTDDDDVQALDTYLTELVSTHFSAKATF